MVVGLNPAVYLKYSCRPDIVTAFSLLQRIFWIFKKGTKLFFSPKEQVCVSCRDICVVSSGILAIKMRHRSIIDGLERMEYRGYDSAGIVGLDNGGFVIERQLGRVKNL